MATDWAADVKKYAANADDAIIAGIVRYCGIALTKVDSSLVAFSDPKELDRVRNNFLKKKLGRAEADSVLDAAIAKVGETMKADRTKNRVTVYYLLADHFKSLGMFAPKAKAAAAKAPAKKPAAKSTAKAAGAAAAVVAGAAASAKKPAAKKTATPAKAPAAKAAAPAKKAAAPAKATTAKKTASTKKAVTPAKAAAAGAAAGALGLASAVPAAAKDAAVKVVDTVGDAAKTASSAAVDTGAAVVGAAGAAAAGAAALATGTASKAASAVSGGAQALSGTGKDDDAGLGLLWWLLALAALLFAALWFFGRGSSADDTAASGATTEASAPVSDAAGAAAGAADLASAPAEGSATIPTGAGVTVELRDGKPVAKVYFDSGKIDVVPSFDATAGGMKQWLADHPGSSLAISGYADPSGNAAQNADLAKRRAQAVQAALVKAGIPEASAVLVKPDSVTDATVAKDAARRVEVVAK